MLEPSFFLQIVINGFVLGFTLTLVASGLTLVFGILRIVNLAHGQFYMLGAFGVWYFAIRLGLNYWLSLLVTMAVVGFIGVLIERFLLRRYRGELLNSAIFSIGIILILSTSVLIIFGTDDKGMRGPFNGSVNLAGAILPLNKLAILIISVILVAVIYLVIWHTKIGRAIRAAAQDPDAARLQGVSMNRVSSMSMFLGSALAAAAGGLLAPVFMVSSTVGMPVLLKSLIAVVVGGIGSIPGVVAASLLIGMVESFATTLAGGAWSELVLFLVLAIVLIIRPQGLFSHA